MMVWSLRVAFALSSYVIIISNLHASYGEGNNQAYQVSTLNQILTPYEQSQYLNNGILPSRVYYDQARGAYVVRGQQGNNQPPNGYTVMPRWRYWLTNIPLAGSLFGKGGGNGDGDENSDTVNSDTNDDEKDDDKNDDDKKGDDKKDDDKKDDDNEGGLLDGVTNSTPVELLGDMMSGDKAEFVKDVVTSELGQEAIKMGIELIPGGAAMLRAYEAGQKINSATGFTDKIGNKFKKD